MGSEMTFGTDPVQASYVLDDPSISALHARLRQTRAGDFLLVDQNSVAGTWVNYDAVGREGQTLQHGDVVNFGNLHFRFTLQKAPKQPAPRVETEEAAK
jgi:pSer/pThr/pTyr-binding forkhead associated (FHA) protein